MSGQTNDALGIDRHPSTDSSKYCQKSILSRHLAGLAVLSEPNPAAARLKWRDEREPRTPRSTLKGYQSWFISKEALGKWMEALHPAMMKTLARSQNRLRDTLARALNRYVQRQAELCQHSNLCSCT